MTLAGVITVAAGYNAAFLALAAIGLLTGLLVLAAMPETLPRESRTAPTASLRPSPEAAAP